MRALRKVDPYTLLILASLATVLILWAAGCFSRDLQKMSASQTAAYMKKEYGWKRVACHRYVGRDDDFWDYTCIADTGDGEPYSVDVRVNAHNVVDQTV